MRFASRMQGSKVNIIREITKKTVQPGFISFAGGNPAPDSFPAEALSELAAKILLERKIESLQYGVTVGNLALRKKICELMAAKGVSVQPENIIVTTGSQQCLDLISRAFLDPSDGVIMEDPTYVAALQIFRFYGASVTAVPMDENGVCCSALEAAVKTGGAKLFYSVPTFQNPSGFTMCDETRHKIPALLEAADMVMVEDDPYSALYYDAEPPKPVKAYDFNGRVIYLGSFSKTIAPGLRVGYAVASKEIIAKLEVAKQSSDLQSSAFTQVLAEAYLSSGLYEKHLCEVRKMYREKRDYMYSLMKERFPASVRIHKPAGGLFLWAELPGGKNAMDLLNLALEKKVAFIPAQSFFVKGDGINAMRLNFSNASLQQIDYGVSLLADITKDFLS